MTDHTFSDLFHFVWTAPGDAWDCCLTLHCTLSCLICTYVAVIFPGGIMCMTIILGEMYMTFIWADFHLELGVQGIKSSKRQTTLLGSIL